MATLTDIAREAGVSVSTASRVLSGDTSLRIRPDTRERVEQIAQRRAYVPNHLARSLRLARTGSVAFVVPEVNNAIFTEVLRGVEDGADELGLDVLIGSGRRIDAGNGFLERLDAERRVDGFLIQPSDVADPNHPDEVFAGKNGPVVWLNTYREDGSVFLDNARAARLATEHLLGLGHTRIGFLGGPAGSFTGGERRDGFTAALAAAGVPLHEEWTMAGGYSAQAGDRAARALLEVRPVDRPTALVVANVNAALGVLGAARQLGVSVPGDVSVVALHDVWFAEYSEPRLTVVRLPLYEMGQHGIRDLSAQLNGQTPLARRIVDPAPELVRRESTAKPPS
jgi:LacI family transcriptional regulator